MMGPLIEVEGLKKYFPVRGGLFQRVTGHVRAVDGVDFIIKRGDIFGLVGESGCGKTTLGRACLRLIEPTGGEIRFEDTDLLKLSLNEMQKMRRDMQMVFQDPFSSLDPRQMVKDIVGEGLVIHGLAEGPELQENVLQTMETVGLKKEHLYRYPHEFSGGQRQRIGVARALILNPKLIVLDEPTSALDVSVQAQILNLLLKLQKELGLTYMFISHNLSVIEYMSDRIAVMYVGKIVEMGTKVELFENPLHPYTRALFSAIPIPDPDFKHEKIILKGDVPSPLNPPSGCRFHPRCPHNRPSCNKSEPELINVGNEHLVACPFWMDLTN
ncbi:MAG: ATP-binding cassette domain-containing protein [Candidatus Bathyarchaeota archaeon]|nr:ATP-binding cassette domain-containing protein [Candidatus Bathyarchaeota archaeon]